MEEKTAIVDDKPTRFMVPTLDVEVTPLALMSGNVSQALEAAKQPAVAGTERTAIEAAPDQPKPRVDYVALAKLCRTANAVRDIYRKAVQAGDMTPTLEGQLKAIAAKLDVKQAVAEPELPVDEEPIEAEVVDDNDPSLLWMQILAAAGGYGWTTDQVEAKFADKHDGVMPGSAESAQLKAFLVAVKRGDVR